MKYARHNCKKNFSHKDSMDGWYKKSSERQIDFVLEKKYLDLKWRNMLSEVIARMWNEKQQ